MNMGDGDKDPTLDQPVAYDAEGQPLYAAPQTIEEGPLVEQQTVRIAAQPEKDIDEESQQKHQESLKAFPNLTLSDGEFVITVIERHAIGVFIPMAVTIGLIALIFAGLLFYPTILSYETEVVLPGVVPVTAIGLLLIVLIGLGGYAAVWIYLKNKLYLTNESLIQEVRLGLFSKREHTVSLARVEDASFRQVGIFQMALDYGTIQLSTVGDESSYKLQFVANPKQQMASVLSAIENFKDTTNNNS